MIKPFSTTQQQRILHQEDNNKTFEFESAFESTFEFESALDGDDNSKAFEKTKRNQNSWYSNNDEENDLLKIINSTTNYPPSIAPLSNDIINSSIDSKEKRMAKETRYKHLQKFWIQLIMYFKILSTDFLFRLIVNVLLFFRETEKGINKWKRIICLPSFNMENPKFRPKFRILTLVI